LYVDGFPTGYRVAITPDQCCAFSITNKTKYGLDTMLQSLNERRRIRHGLTVDSCDWLMTHTIEARSSKRRCATQIACTPLKDALIDAEMALRLMREQRDLKEKSDD
jgi:hypothetical protein